MLTSFFVPGTITAGVASIPYDTWRQNEIPETLIVGAVGCFLRTPTRANAWTGYRGDQSPGR